VFPFKYNGVTYNSCTTDGNVLGVSWCSTEVDDDGNTVSGNWGDCPDTPSCTSPQTTTTTTTTTTPPPCITSGGPKPGLPCVFPFTSGGQTYTSCTTNGNILGVAWCPTEVDGNGNTVWNQWGDCPDTASCAAASPQSTTASPSTTATTEGNIIQQLLQGIMQIFQQPSPTCTTSGGPKPEQPCVFPFNYNEVTYNSCTTEGNILGQAWCSTMVDDNGDTVSGNWGDCPDTCL